MSKTREVRPFGARDKFGYLFGDLANDFSFIFASTYVMVFYTKVMGISAAMVGTMFLIARCIDAFTDIGMGRIVDNSKPTKNGHCQKRHFTLSLSCIMSLMRTSTRSL